MQYYQYIYLHVCWSSNLCIILSWFTAPSVVAQPMITPSGENRVDITWETPENENGVLLPYQVVIFNELHNFSNNTTIDLNKNKSVNFDGLGKSKKHALVIRFIKPLHSSHRA